MRDDAVLQLHLGQPLTVNCGKLLLGLNPIVVDAQNLALRALFLDFGKPVLAGGRTAGGRGRIRAGFGLKRIVRRSQACHIALRLLHRLLNQPVAVALGKPGLDPPGKRPVLPG